MNELKMNKLSEEFSSLFFKYYPEFRKYLIIKSYDFSDDREFELKELLESH